MQNLDLFYNCLISILIIRCLLNWYKEIFFPILKMTFSKWERGFAKMKNIQ